MPSKITTSRSPGGRLLTIEWRDDATLPGPYLEGIAQHGGTHGYVVVSEERAPDAAVRRQNGSVQLRVSLLLQPATPPARGTFFSVMSALALARTIRRHSPYEPRIRWVSDVLVGKHTIAKATTRAALRQTGSFQYVIVNLSLLINESFVGNLTDIVRSVFQSRRETLSERIAETLITEFFSLYESTTGGDMSAILAEYREVSLLLGKHIRILQDGKRLSATVMGIDDDAHLVVSLRHGRSLALTSAAELYDPHRAKQAIRAEKAQK